LFIIHYSPAQLISIILQSFALKLRHWNLTIIGNPSPKILTYVPQLKNYST
jgi:hypothetical protein